MATRPREAEVSLINDRVDILNKNAVKTFPAKKVFRAVSSILALVRDRMINSEDSVLLSGYCFDVCEALSATIQAKNADNLDGSIRTALEDLERVMREIGLTLRKGASLPHIEYGKDKVEEHKLEIREILDVLNVSSSPLDEIFGAGKRAHRLAPFGPQFTTKTSGSKSACERLIHRAFALPELPSLIEEIFSSKDVEDTIGCLHGDDTQAFVDVIDEVLNTSNIPPQTRRKCLKSLYRMCGRHALLPQALKIPVSYDRTGVALCRGGFADVWKGVYSGRDVAVKVIRTYSNSDLQKITGRFCKEVMTWKTLQHPNVLRLVGVTMSETQFAMVSDWMANGNINDFVKVHQDVNRLELLGGVARGLIYIHNQGMVHGDLKGANILIDQSGCALLADFARWMSPELIAPQRFGFKNSRPRKPSDCYALGMVIYETISGNLPFHGHADLTVIMKVLEGEYPPRGTRFTKGLWEMLEQCWASQPNNRPSIEDVLWRLEISSILPEPPFSEMDAGVENDGDDWDSDNSSTGVPDEALASVYSVTFNAADSTQAHNRGTVGSYDHKKVGMVWGTIPTSIPNVRRIAAFLREHRGYTDIVIMTDEPGVEERYRPTERNLEREISALCRGVAAGDRRFFYYAGHSGQLPCPTGGEEDEKDETVVTVDGTEIRDNTLHNWLVKPLPNGSALTAIFDSCNSGTLLDLAHYKCNNVYRPWINKGKRRSNTLPNRVTSPKSEEHSREPEEHDRESPETKHNGERCASPESMFMCDGWCRKTTPRMTTFDHPDVISISSSGDGQTSWDASTRDDGSISMTTFLVEILERKPQITYSELMTLLNHKVYTFTKRMHCSVKEQRRARRMADGKSADPEGVEPEDETNTIQGPQLGSLSPVDMDRLFVI